MAKQRREKSRNKFVEKETFILTSKERILGTHLL